jgi:hypothetical protein
MIIAMPKSTNPTMVRLMIVSSGGLQLTAEHDQYRSSQHPAE